MPCTGLYCVLIQCAGGAAGPAGGVPSVIPATIRAATALTGGLSAATLHQHMKLQFLHCPASTARLQPTPVQAYNVWCSHASVLAFISHTYGHIQCWSANPCDCWRMCQRARMQWLHCACAWSLHVTVFCSTSRCPCRTVSRRLLGFWWLAGWCGPSLQPCCLLPYVVPAGLAGVPESGETCQRADPPRLLELHTLLAAADDEGPSDCSKQDSLAAQATEDSKVFGEYPEVTKSLLSWRGMSCPASAPSQFAYQACSALRGCVPTALAKLAVLAAGLL